MVCPLVQLLAAQHDEGVLSVVLLHCAKVVAQVRAVPWALLPCCATARWARPEVEQGQLEALTRVGPEHPGTRVAANACVVGSETGQVALQGGHGLL